MRAAQAVFVLALFAGTSRLEGQEGRQIAGRVLSAGDSAALVAVWIGTVGGASTLTDSAGRFSLPVPRGPVRLAIRRVGLVADTTLVPPDRDSVTIFARNQAVRLAPVGVEAEVSPARARFDTLAQPSIVTLSPRDITRAPGLLEPDVMRVIQLLPGTVARSDYSILYNVRGGESDQNLVLLDGITVFNPSHLAGLFTTFDINAVDRADFLTGGFPAEYSGRLSSVLAIRVRPGSSERVHASGGVSLLLSKLLVEAPAGPAPSSSAPAAPTWIRS
ncbi:MAG: TonB-dependent receptor plug domain-containing protein [Gemmatimonadetes bacterium]|nr:TonB-dependent receptor plug domain-containing protein [Gemmatimonadota bacterium]